MTADPALTRWRLLLGAAAETACGGLTGDSLASEAALDWLYCRDAGEVQREQMTREGGSGPSALSVPDWVNEVHRLFPKETIERLERDAVERFGIVELVTDPKVLERLEPNPALLEAVLRTRHLMNPNVLAMARQLVARVVRELIPQAHFATVYAKPMGRPLVDTFITEVSQDTWIFFPWEKRTPS